MKQLNQILSLQYDKHTIRYEENEGIRFYCAKDICKILEIHNNRSAVSQFKEVDKKLMSASTNGGGQKLVFVSEWAMCQMAFTSRKPSAKPFRKWLLNNILPSATQEINLTQSPNAKYSSKDFVNQSGLLVLPPEHCRSGLNREQVEAICNIRNQKDRKIVMDLIFNK